MHELKIGETDLLSTLRPDTLYGAVIYLALFVGIALAFSRALRAAVHAAMTRKGRVDLTTISFLQQFGTALIWVIMLILYAHLIPVLHSMGNALLAGASIASVVIGLAAQTTLGNLVAGLSITIYRPFRLGDKLQVATPTGTEIGEVELISLGYTTLRTSDGRHVVMPNSLAASQVTLNLTQMHTSAAFAVTIRVPRDVDLEAAQRSALETAKQVVGESGVKGCYLKTIEPAAAVLVLSVDASGHPDADATRARLIRSLAQRFSADGLDGAAHERASFA